MVQEIDPLRLLICLAAVKFSPADLQVLANVKTLQKIRLLNHKIDHDMLDGLKSIKSLREIQIANDKEFSPNKNKLRQALPAWVKITQPPPTFSGEDLP